MSMCLYLVALKPQMSASKLTSTSLLSTIRVCRSVAGLNAESAAGSFRAQRVSFLDCPKRTCYWSTHLQAWSARLPFCERCARTCVHSSNEESRVNGDKVMSIIMRKGAVLPMTLQHASCIALTLAKRGSTHSSGVPIHADEQQKRQYTVLGHAFQLASHSSL